MQPNRIRHALGPLFFLLLALVSPVRSETVALWLFDEQEGLYPSCVLDDASSGDFPLVLGRGGQLLQGKYGRSLEALLQPDSEVGLQQLRVDFGGIVDRLGHVVRTFPEDSLEISWANAQFCGLMTRGEQHLRQEVNFGSPTRSRLNLGNFDWTVEFWYLPTRRTGDEGVVIELGSGPRGQNRDVTRLALAADQRSFSFTNRANETQLVIPSAGAALKPGRSEWHHLAFVFDAANRQLRHYVDGQLQQLPARCELRPLPEGEHDYLSVGRDSTWKKALPGRLDELRISDHQVYSGQFTPPETFSQLYRDDYLAPQLHQGPPLLFDTDRKNNNPLPLGKRKYVFIDDAIIAHSENLTFRVNPPRVADCVIPDAMLGNHLVVYEDDDGFIRLYGCGPQKCLVVLTSLDGIHFEEPDLGRDYLGKRNVVIEDPVGLGTLFDDPNAVAGERIKYFSGYRGRGHFVYSSPDGYSFRRNETSALPMRGASQSIVYYDDQRQEYVGFHRSDMLRTIGGKSERMFVRTTTTDVMRPWPFRPVSTDEYSLAARQRRLGKKIPYFVDNGPLTPPGFGIEYPLGFGPDPSLDPLGTDVYVPKCVKYSWAPDTYLAFPLMYFHYQGDGPVARRTLGLPQRNRGSGPLETQLATSRDGIRWQRYPRPAYIGIGRHVGTDLKKIYIAHGMVRRQDEIWQYYIGSEQYHSPWQQKHGKDAVFRAVQRLDGFVSADTAYTGGTLTTRPLTFDGRRLVLNINTGATGYAQVGLLDQHGQPIEGYGVDDCIYINGDYVETEVEWLKKGKDLEELAGQPVSISIRSRGTKLYSMKFME